MSTTLQSLQDLPWSAHALAGVASAGGAALCFLGQHLLKPVILILFGVLGGVAGLTVATFTTVGDSVGLLGGVLGGMVAGGLAGLLLWRVAMAIGVAVVVGLAAPLTVMVLLEATAPPMPSDGWDNSAPAAAGDQYRRSVEKYNDLVGSLGDSARDAAGRSDDEDPAESVRAIARSAAGEAAQEVREFVGAVREETGAQWDQMPVRHRLAIGVAGIGGAMLGFLLGLAMPRWAGGAATAMFGAAVAIPAAVWLAHGLDVPGSGRLDGLSARGWLIVWASVSVAGMATQWRRGRGGGDPGPGPQG